MAQGGFDTVIGNPPWGGDIDKDLGYFHTKYPATTQEHTDSFKLFIEVGLRLVRNGGLVSMIAPNTLLRQRRLRDTRSLLLQNQILALVDLGEDVFKEVIAPACIFVVRKGKPTDDHRVLILDLSKLPIETKVDALGDDAKLGSVCEQRTFLDNADLEFVSMPRKYAVPVVPIGDFDEVVCKDAGINYQRVNVGMQEKGKSDLAGRLLYEGERQREQDKMYWKGTDIDRYWIAESTLRYCRPDFDDFIRPNEVVRLNENVYRAVPKILLRQTADHITATIDYRGVWFGRSIIAILLTHKSVYKIEYFLGLLNSRYFEWLYHKLVYETGRVFAQVKLSKIKQLPTRRIDFNNAVEKKMHDDLVALVDKMLELNKRLAHIRNTPCNECDELLREIDRTDKEIDNLVYNLYGLTEEERRIVSEGNRLE
jgi:adenine-specific DNA-methyltransferase